VGPITQGCVLMTRSVTTMLTTMLLMPGSVVALLPSPFLSIRPASHRLITGSATSIRHISLCVREGSGHTAERARSPGSGGRAGQGDHGNTKVTRSGPGKRGGGSSPLSRSQPSASNSRGQPKAIATRRALKEQQRAANHAKVEAKLAADASFFWECVHKRAEGVDVSGASGTVPRVHNAESLFGTSSPAVGMGEYDTIPVSRTGDGASEGDVPPMGEGFTLSGKVELPPFLRANLLGVERMHISSPTPIQRHCVPLALQGQDVMACAQTGSGKTVAFLLPIITRLAEQPPPPAMPQPLARPEAKGVKGRLGAKLEAVVRARGTPACPSALILAPTRELAIQIELECSKLTYGAARPPSGAALWCSSCYGGATARPQLEALSGGVEILVATPGRLVDFVTRNLVSLRRCGTLVLDEADRMLDMGFEPQVRTPDPSPTPPLSLSVP
jgi:hypothetical protein